MVLPVLIRVRIFVPVVISRVCGVARGGRSCTLVVHPNSILCCDDNKKEGIQYCARKVALDVTLACASSPGETTTTTTTSTLLAREGVV